MQLPMQVKIKKLHPDAVIPAYAKPGDAGMDLYAVTLTITPDYVEYDTGLAMEIPEGYVGLLFPRSSISNTDLILANSTAVIDSGFRGTLRLRFKELRHDEDRSYASWYQVGDRVGQIMIIPYPQVKFVEAEELTLTERGEAGFGSTDAKN